jgi:hypothetical protein
MNFINIIYFKAVGYHDIKIQKYKKNLYVYISKVYKYIYQKKEFSRSIIFQIYNKKSKDNLNYSFE